MSGAAFGKRSTPLQVSGPNLLRSSVFACTFNLGTAGAVGTDDAPPGITLTKNGTGDYTLSFFACRVFKCLDAHLESPTLATAADRRQTMYGDIDASAGTMNILTVAADGTGTGANPVNSCFLHVSGLIDYS